MLALNPFEILKLYQTCPCTGRTTTFKNNGWALEISPHFPEVSEPVCQSGGFSMEIGVLYLSIKFY